MANFHKTVRVNPGGYTNKTQAGSNYQKLRLEESGQMGASKVTQFSNSNPPHNSNDPDSGDHLRPYVGAKNDPPHLHQRRLSIEDPNRARRPSIGEDDSEEEDLYGNFLDVLSPSNSVRFSQSEDFVVDPNRERRLSIGGDNSEEGDPFGRLSQSEELVPFLSEAEKSSEKQQMILSSEQQREQFIKFLFSDNQDSEKEIKSHLACSSPEELKKFSTYFSEVVDFLLDPESSIQFTNEVPFQKMSFIIEGAVRRYYETLCCDYILNTLLAEQLKSNDPNVENLKKEYCLSENEKNVLKEASFHLKTTFTKIKHYQHERFLTVQALQEAEHIRKDFERTDQMSVLDRPQPKQEASKNKFDLTFQGEREISKNPFQVAYDSIKDEIYTSCLLFFQKFFQDALSPSNTNVNRTHNQSYTQALTTLNNALRVWAQPAYSSIKAITSKTTDESWWISIPNRFYQTLFPGDQTSSPSVGYQSIQEGKVRSQGQEISTTEIKKIEAILNNTEQLQKIKNDNPENKKASVNALDELSKQDQSLIITAGKENQQNGVEVEKKSAWSFIRLYQWLVRTPEQKENYRTGIKAARYHVGSKYGPYAVERFDAHFALRYRKGSPLTVRALNEFITNEKKLLRESPSDSSRQGVVFLKLKDASPDQFANTILDYAKEEFDLRYYVYNSTNETFERPYGMKAISKEDKAVLFASFYQDYLQRPVVVQKRIPEQIQGRGFFQSRWNAMWATGWSHGNNKKANQELEKALLAWMNEHLPSTGWKAIEQDVKSDIQDSLNRNGKLTLQEVDNFIMVAIEKAGKENTWKNSVFYNIWKPIIGSFATMAGIGAAAKLVTSDSSMVTGAAKAATLGAAYYALGEDKPGLQLSAGLAALWTATTHPNVGNSAVGTIIETGTKWLKSAAIGYAGLHFPPLWLLYLT